MGLEQTRVIDVIGTDRASGDIVLTIFDAWDWSDERLHLQALIDKVDAYFKFIETGQIIEDYPEAVGRRLRIDIVTRYNPAPAGVEFIARLGDLASELNIAVSHRVVEDRSAAAT